MRITCGLRVCDFAEGGFGRGNAEARNWISSTPTRVDERGIDRGSGGFN
jgi:hypothetical protein